MTGDLPAGYRWATEAETELYGRKPDAYPGMIVVPRTADSAGTPYIQDESDLALPLIDAPERVEAILRRYGVAERDIGRCCDDLSPHLRPPGTPRGPRYTDSVEG